MNRIKVVGREPLLRTPLPDPDLGSSGGSPFTIDLSELAFACPLDLTGIVAWGQRVPSESRGEVLLPPSDVASYLLRMNVVDLLRRGGWAIAETVEQPRAELAHKLLEVTELHGPNEVEALSDQLPQLFTRAGGGSRWIRAMHFAFGELCDNAVTHSNGSLIYVAAQRYSGTTSGGPPRLDLAIADNGIGIGNHLRRNPKHAHTKRDERALALALKEGVSGTSEDRGYGFHDVLREAAEVGRGEMVIHSGLGTAFVPWGVKGRRRTFRRLRANTSGTWIQVRIFED